MRKKKYEIIVWIVILAVIPILAIGSILFAKPGKYVDISIDGKTKYSYDINADGSYTINGVNGGKNIITISSGKVYMNDADCPDRLCVDQGSISKVGQSIICLPHKVVVSIVEEEKNNHNEVDAIAQ